MITACSFYLSNTYFPIPCSKLEVVKTEATGWASFSFVLALSGRDDGAYLSLFTISYSLCFCTCFVVLYCFALYPRLLYNNEVVDIKFAVATIR